MTPNHRYIPCFEIGEFGGLPVFHETGGAGDCDLEIMTLRILNRQGLAIHGRDGADDVRSPPFAGSILLSAGLRHRWALRLRQTRSGQQGG
jgi:hypothetical protein